MKAGWFFLILSLQSFQANAYEYVDIQHGIMGNRINKDVKLLQLEKKAITQFDGKVVLRDVKAPIDVKTNVILRVNNWLFYHIDYDHDKKEIKNQFITLGNLKTSPLFLTVGKQALPYADFNSLHGKIKSLPKLLFSQDKNAVMLGLYSTNSVIRVGHVANEGTLISWRDTLNLNPMKIKLGLGHLQKKTHAISDGFLSIYYKNWQGEFELTVDSRIAYTLGLACNYSGHKWLSYSYSQAYQIEKYSKLHTINWHNKFDANMSFTLSAGFKDKNPILISELAYYL
jgi:hypothetical protein